MYGGVLSKLLTKAADNQADDVGRAVAKRAIQEYAMDGASKLTNSIDNIAGNTAKQATLIDILKPAIKDVDDVDLSNYRKFNDYANNDAQLELDRKFEQYMNNVSDKINDALGKAGYDPDYVYTNTEHSGASSDANYFNILNDKAKDGNNAYAVRAANHRSTGSGGGSDLYLTISDYQKASEIGDRLAQATMDFLDKTGAKPSKKMAERYKNKLSQAAEATPSSDYINSLKVMLKHNLFDLMSPSQQNDVKKYGLDKAILK